MRLPNLIIIALSMVLVQYTIINPITAVNNFNASLSTLVFSLIVLSTVCVAAGGYIVNDLLDVKIDLINKPDKVIVGKRISLATSWNLYWVLTAIGVLLGIIGAWYNKTNVLMSVAPLEAGLLWLYSSILKKYFLVGNLVVSFLCGLALFKPMLFNAPIVKVEGLVYLVLGYTAFAFMLTLIREIIKDMEDIKGDEAYDCKTMPVVIGITATKIIAAIFLLSVMLSLGWFQYNQTLSDTFKQTDYLSFSYIGLFIQLPLIILLILLLKAKESVDFHRASNISKLIMVTGILSMVVFYLLF
ncbi:MAG: geranylgeranylglycerol-phosphate geranylgeranyltransferase [Bacteroidia bacterium]